MIGTQDAQQNNRNDVVELTRELMRYKTTDSIERSYIGQFIQLLSNPNCFERTCFPAHITGSAMLVNKSGTQVLLHHHKFLNKWLNFGGHADGQSDILAVAIRETMEESGLTDFRPVSPDFIDIDIHPIPANPKKGEPDHFHYDIRYLMRMNGDQKPVISDESIDLKWVTFEEAFAMTANNNAMQRLLQKTKIAIL